MSFAVENINIVEIFKNCCKTSLLITVLQITTLVNHKERTKVTEKMAQALTKVGKTVTFAVKQFLTFGKSISIGEIVKNAVKLGL